MSTIRSSRFSSAHVMAGLALFISLGGTSYAVTKLPKNSVGSQQVKDGSLTAKDLKAEALKAGPTGATGARGPRGADGPAGPAGPAGATGPAGASAGGTLRLAGPGAVTPLSRTNWQKTTILQISNIPPGKYRADFAGTVNYSGTSARVDVWCDFGSMPVSDPIPSKTSEFGIIALGVGSRRVGDPAAEASPSTVVPLANFSKIESAVPFHLIARCWTGVIDEGANVALSHTKLAATPFDSFG